MNPENRDDLYDELLEDLRSIAFVGQSTGERLADRAEEHADRRVSQVLRIVAQNLDYPTDRDLMESAADRFDPDVATDEEN